MNRLDSMRERLPPIWSSDEGTTTRAFLAVIATWLGAFDEDMDRVQRSHWVDAAFDLEDLRRLGALFDIAPAPWETERLFRVRLKATIAARLRGAVTRDVLEYIIVAVLGGVQAELGSRYFDLPTTVGPGQPVFHRGPAERTDQPAFIEFPIRRRRSPDLVAAGGLLRPLARVPATNRGLFPAGLQAVIRGVAGHLTTVPLIANLTNGQVVVYAGALACGEELRLGIDKDGAVTAVHGDRDVRARVVTASGFVPGAALTPVLPDPTPQPLMLERGDNDLWFFPLALYDQPGLGTGVFAMPAADLRHGRFAGKGAEVQAAEVTPFDRALFEQGPAVSLDLWWDEAAPASFRFEIPAGIVRRDATAAVDAATERARLFDLLGNAIRLLRAAGVDGRVEARPFRAVQRQSDRVRVLDPTRLADTQRMAVRLSGLSALFDVSAVDGARFE